MMQKSLIILPLLGIFLFEYFLHITYTFNRTSFWAMYKIQNLSYSTLIQPLVHWMNMYNIEKQRFIIGGR